MNHAFIKETGLLKWAGRTVVRKFHTRVLRRDHAMHLPSGLRFALPRSSHFASEAFVTNGDVDWGGEALLFKLLRNEGHLLDVGANIGYYSLYMAPAVKGVFAFEPDPRMMALLKKNVADCDKIQTVQKAVSSQSGSASFVLEASGEISHLARDAAENAGGIVVEMTTVDAFVAEREIAIEAIKIDVEGFDVDVVRGALQTLQIQRPYVFTEAQATPELMAMMREVRFKVLCFARNIKSREKTFIEIEDGVPAGLCTKMLFLVPEEKVGLVRAALLNC